MLMSFICHLFPCAGRAAETNKAYEQNQAEFMFYVMCVKGDLEPPLYTTENWVAFSQAFLQRCLDTHTIRTQHLSITDTAFDRDKCHKRHGDSLQVSNVHYKTMHSAVNDGYEQERCVCVCTYGTYVRVHVHTAFTNI